MNSDLRAALTSVRRRIESACARASRAPDSVQLLAVAKTFGADRVRALAACGQHAFGENYVQEALAKQALLTDLGLEWHFIGHCQTNKVRDLARHFSWVHGLDRLRLAERLSAAATGERDTPLQVCVQVNISGEASKSGCRPEQALELCQAVHALPGLRLRGLMAIPAPGVQGAGTRQAYIGLRSCFEALRAAGLVLDTLSAGMSDDFEFAIAEGSTLVRVGSALFGRRPAKDNSVPPIAPDHTA